MHKKEKMSFIAGLYRWARDNRCVDPDEYREKCKYLTREAWQKEIIDNYIGGIADVRDSEYDTVHYFDKAEPGWMKGD